MNDEDNRYTRKLEDRTVEPDAGSCGPGIRGMQEPDCAFTHRLGQDAGIPPAAGATAVGLDGRGAGRGAGAVARAGVADRGCVQGHEHGLQGDELLWRASGYG